ncbi:Oidioi.mRNA.OKI2018_I69.PAR.g11196.t1.cds [Oikopleura dioica]|uniref:Oidioi.mRNA.OKI2018_I69.PAR.g11196.t1.cds n=1 Tax=Oikopleura dioica TaxID=34765 RepID=A0ABN7RUL0_OIKDI|nr:Oidioi.mRNA.OKI2018_I69.PAR.g11196.t1.cds [Oikopleura dioica]
MHALDTGGRDKASKQDRVGEVLEAIGIWDFKKSIQRELKRYPSHDPLKLKKLQIMSDRINVLSAQEYEHHVYCQRASFYGYATQQRNNIFKTNDAVDSR